MRENEFVRSDSTQSSASGHVFELPVIALRSIAAYLFIAFYIGLAGLPGVILAMIFRWPDVLYRLGKWGVQGGLALAGIRYRVEGTEHIRPDRPAVYCVNHTSNVEPPVLYLVLERLFPRLSLIYKAELHRIPILSQGFDFVGFVPIERGNRDKSLQAIERAARALREGFSFLVFPEGTRSRTGELLRFKKGGFLMAIKAQAAVVPVAIRGARESMRKGSPFVRPTTIRIRLGAPIETAGMTLADRDRLIARTREEIQKMLATI